MNGKIYLNGLGFVHPSGGLPELLAAFSGSVPEAEAAPRPTLKELLPGVNLRRVPRSARMALEASALALRDAGLPARLDEGAAPRAGVFTGSAHCCVEASFGFMDSIIDFGPKLSSPTAFSLSVNNVFTGMISLYLNTQGPGYTACQFGASFAGAFAAAVGSLLSGGCDLVLVGAVEENSPLLGEVYQRGLAASGVNPDTFTDWELPATECAVFFVLGREKGPAGVEVCAPVWSRKAADAPDLIFSILERHPDSGPASAPILDCRGLYGSGPAMQALDVALAYCALRHALIPAPAWCASGVLPHTLPDSPPEAAPQSALCECFSALVGSYSAISLRKA